MDAEKRKIIAMGIHDLDEAETSLSQMVKVSLANGGPASERLTTIINHAQKSGFFGSQSKQSLASQQWLMEELIRTPDLMQILAAGAYCGLWRATIVVAQQNNE